MAARVPRRSFATPFVLTLAAVPACHSSSPQPAPPVAHAPNDPPSIVMKNPPPPTTTLAPDEQPPPQPVIVNPPPPSSAPLEQASWTVFRGKDGCMAAIKVACPTGEPGKPMPTCNPPPPFKYACPTGVTVDKPVTVITFGDSCAVEPEAIHCPPHAACNPPRPRTVPCPKP